MPDQANELRSLVRQCAAPRGATAPQRPSRIVVFGAKGGVGTTTLCVNLAAAVARVGVRCVLLDAGGGDAAVLCRIEPRYTVADVLSGTKRAARAMQSGPGGFLVLPGTRELARANDDALAAWERVLAQGEMPEMGSGLVVIDAGSRPDRLAQRLWQAADRVLLVMTPEPAAVMNAYAAIKLLAAPGIEARSASEERYGAGMEARSASEGKPDAGMEACSASKGRHRAPPIHVLVNCAPDRHVAEEVYGRLAHVCRRFLALPLGNVGYIPIDAAVRDSGLAGEPFVVTSPNCAASRQLRQLAERLTLKLAARGRAAA